MTDSSCIFCEIGRGRSTHIHETRHTFAIRDIAPDAPGHTLVIAKRHVPTVFDLTDDEWLDLGQALRTLRDHLGIEQSTDAFNIGINTGAEAGQTVFHAHVHIIPRQKHDRHHTSDAVRDVS